MSENVLLKVPDRSISLAKMKVDRAAWALKYYQKFDREKVLKIADAVAKAAYEKASYFAEKAVEETGYGVAEHKKLKNQLCTHELVDYYRDCDLVTPRVNEAKKIIEIPRPAGVIFALAPVTNPIATVYYKSLLAILSRNAVVFSPHPMAKECSNEAAKYLAEVAQAAGAPSGLIQCVEAPSVPLVEELMASNKINVIMATGGNMMVRAAYSSGNPALGVGSGNAVAYIDPSANVDKAAKALVESKSFDNSILCTNESICLTLEENFSNMQRALRTAGAHICNEEQTDKMRGYLWRDGKFNLEAIGKSAQWIADKAGINVNPSVKILVPVVSKPSQDDLLFKEKLCPVLTLTAAVDFQQVTTFSSHVAKRGAGHSAAFHGSDQARLLAFSSAMPVYRVVVNAPCSQGAAGFATYLPPSFMIGTGYFGRSSIGENVGPQHLVHWTRIAYARDEDVDLNNIDFTQMNGATSQVNNVMASVETVQSKASNLSSDRDQIRQLILEELRSLKDNI